MKIELSGFNIETDNMEKSGSPDRDLLTPEIFSSAYARISRSSKSVTELRSEARKDIEKARRSNRKIIFGMGHHSVAEHAVFNFDVTGISRLALESMERFRLASYTEKSQRYVTLDGDYLTPDEFKDERSIREFTDVVRLQNETYIRFFRVLKDYIFDAHPELAADRSNKNLLEGWAKEDARYVLSLATLGQVGMTLNARTLEHLLRKFSLSPLTEVRGAGEKMYELAGKVAPSLILFPEPSVFEKDLNERFSSNFTFSNVKPVSGEFQMIDHDVNGDDRIIASFLSEFGSAGMDSALETVSGMSRDEKKGIFLDLFKNMEFFDSPPRNFELAEFTFQAVVSASNFAQLKRHRMASLLTGEYRTGHGNTIPENIVNAGMKEEFMAVISETNSVYSDLKEAHGAAADYVLTNSHRRRVIMKMNLREAFHFVRLRSDVHAQWDIKSLSDSLLVKIKEFFPFSSLLLCGKSDFAGLFESIYNRKPKFNI